MFSGLPPKAGLTILELLTPPALGERGHRGLARRLAAVRRRAVFVLAEGKRPEPRRAYWRGGRLHDAADDSAVGEHVEIVVAPLAGRPRSGRALEDQFLAQSVGTSRQPSAARAPCCTAAAKAVS